MKDKSTGIIILAILVFCTLLQAVDSPILWGILAGIGAALWLLCIFVAWKDRKKQLF